MCTQPLYVLHYIRLTAKWKLTISAVIQLQASPLLALLLFMFKYNKIAYCFFGRDWNQLNSLLFSRYINIKYRNDFTTNLRHAHHMHMAPPQQAA